MIPGYDDWKTSQNEPPVIEKCDCCGAELGGGDMLYTVDGEKLCEVCVRDNYGRVL